MQTDKTPRIRIVKNGPYLVSGGVPVEQQSILNNSEGCPSAWRKDKDIPVRERYSLCRCGHTRNPPFCDGAHLKAQFDGTETASRKPYLEQADKIPGPGLDLTDAETLCSAAGFCNRAGGIWKLIEMSNDEKAKKIAIQEAADCPSGRLIVWDKAGKAIEPVFQASIVSTEEPAEGVSGPLWVRGGIPIESADGTVYEKRNSVTICRCGKSCNKPFCDGKHAEK